MALELTPVIQPKETDGTGCSELDIVKEEVEFQDDCPVMPKMKSHIVARGQCATLQKTLSNRDGNPVDLTTCSCVSQSVSDSVDDPFCGIKVRFMEVTGQGSSDPVFEAEASIKDLEGGVVQVTLPVDLVKMPAIYREEWGVFNNDGLLVFTCTGLLFVEAGLFGLGGTGAVDLSTRNFGPPSVMEIRLSIRDNAPSENVLLDDVEFSDSELALAVMRPIREFNDHPPPLTTRFTTKTFPFKDFWLTGIQGYLYDIAASWYRRNRLGTTAGGIRVDDLNKEKEYLQASQLMLARWREFLLLKKVEINAREAVGTVGSTYGGAGGF